MPTVKTRRDRRRLCRAMRTAAAVVRMVAVAAFLCSGARAQAPPGMDLRLAQATMCEAIREFVPVNSAVAFPVERGEVLCFTRFETVPEKTFVQHRWYYRDRLVTERRLTIQPPQWSTYSAMQLRGADRGPWRVDVIDERGRVLRRLRFSITD